LSSYFHSCIPTPLAAISTLLGTLSIVSWLFAQLPQIYKNYQIKSTAGLSVFFLVEWLLGDATNLLGALFTGQATWQVIIASYYVFVDVCLVVQYFWYSWLTRKFYGESLHSSASSDSGDDCSDMINSLSPINTSFRDDDAPSLKDDEQPELPPPSQLMTTPQFQTVNYEKSSNMDESTSVTEKYGSSWLTSPSPRTLMLAMTLSGLARPAVSAPIPSNSDPHGIHLFTAETPLEVAGMILSWSSTLLYLGSRLPQLYKNWTRQSTAGLSPLLFFAAFCGNFFYSTSLLTNPNAWHNYEPYGGHGWADPHGSLRGEWIARAAPFFLGAFGVLGLDGMMGVQFLLYGEDEDKIVKVRDGNGHSHWERVNGWMRGWIPTIVGKEKVVELAESQRLLGESRHQLSRRSTNEYGLYGAL
jgi:solute carrier family 66 (lysosomal lysine-arginine transporter), member 1